MTSSQRTEDVIAWECERKKEILEVSMAEKIKIEACGVRDYIDVDALAVAMEADVVKLPPFTTDNYAVRE